MKLLGYQIRVLLGAVLLAAPAITVAQTPPVRAKRAYPAGPRRAPLQRRQLAASPRRFSAQGTVNESEPNNDYTTANLVALGDTASGTIDPAGDVDFYAVDVPADTLLVLDVQANNVGSALDPILELFDTDGTTLLAYNDDYNGLDSHIEFHITRPGRYFVSIVDYSSGGGSGYFYHLSFTATAPPPLPPGDVTTLYAASFGLPFGMTAGGTGELYVTDAPRVARVGPSGNASTYFDGLGTPYDVVVDGLGDLLVAGQGTDGLAFVDRITPAGQLSTFASFTPQDSFATALAVGPDGDVWVGMYPARAILHHDAAGTLKGAIDVSAAAANGYVDDIAFSPAGELYFSNAYDAVFKIVGNASPLVFQSNPYLEGIAFDKDGYLYVANGYLGKVILLDPTGQVVSDPFAQTNLGGPIHLAFLRSAAGAMTARLVADNFGYNLSPPYAGGIVEMNPAGMRAAGFRVGVNLSPLTIVTVAAASDHLLGGVPLDAARQRYLDAHGNNNGRLDVGDFRSYLRANGQLSAAAALVRKEQP